jgi:non-canonical purine NTP pyrophosphatase (RdgB/HAM1 family)
MIKRSTSKDDLMQTTELLVATQNPGKLREYENLLADLPVTLLSLDDVGLGDMDVEETGDTFAANALLKARAYAEASGKLTLADDSGLCVDALGGAPGVFSKRFGEPALDDAGRRRALLDALRYTPDDERDAYFACVIALVDPLTGTEHHVEGRCNGYILHEDRDDGHGFGYDALFLPDGYDRTFAQIPRAEKNDMSHRGDAGRKIVPIVREMVTRTK